MATVTENSGQTAKDSGSGSDSGPGEPRKQYRRWSPSW